MNELDLLVTCSTDTIGECIIIHYTSRGCKVDYNFRYKPCIL